MRELALMALGVILGILIGLAAGHFMPCYGAEPATRSGMKATCFERV